MFALKNKLMGIVNPGGGGGAPKLRLIANAVIGAVQNMSGVTIVNFGNTIKAEGITFNGTDATITKAGDYNVSAFIDVNSVANNRALVALQINGVNVNAAELLGVTGMTRYKTTISSVFSFNVGDTIRVIFFSNDAAAFLNNDANNYARLSIIEI